MSAFLSALSTIVEMGAVGEVVHRLTDSGPDNECASTHALNCTVVHVGATNRLRWLRLHPKHSHNLADRYNAMVKQQMWPQGGVGGGCNAPFEMEGNHTALHRIAPHRAALRRTAPRRTAPHRTAPHRTAPPRTAPHRTAPHRTAPQMEGNVIPSHPIPCNPIPSQV
jgi:hypothetical protein